MPADRTATLVPHFRRRLELVTARSSLALALAWDDLDGYDRINVPEFDKRAQPILKAGRAAAVTLAAGFYTAISATKPAGISPRTIQAPFDPHAPFYAYWGALKEGRPWDEAVTVGRSRAEAAATDHIVSASRRTGDAVAQKTGQRISGWQRITGPGACDWCELVAGQTYSSAESADFGHDRCDCTAVPIFA